MEKKSRGRFGGLAAALLVAATPVLAQDGADRETELVGRPAATLADFAWLEGVWVGPGPEGATNETRYMAPAAGVLPGMMRLHDGEKLMVLEFFDILPGQEGLEMRLRHFDAELSAWESGGPLVLYLDDYDGRRSAWKTAPGTQPGIASEIVRGDGYYETRTVITRPDGSRQVMDGKMVRQR